MQRRSLALAVGLLLASTAAGCLGPGGATRTETPSPAQVPDLTATETPDQMSTPECFLDHAIVDDEEDEEFRERYSYSSLSERAQTIVDRTLAANGSIYRVENLSAAPSEFRYSDDYSRYLIERNGTTIRLITGTGMGCSPDKDS